MAYNIMPLSVFDVARNLDLFFEKSKFGALLMFRGVGYFMVCQFSKLWRQQALELLLVLLLLLLLLYVFHHVLVGMTVFTYTGARSAPR